METLNSTKPLPFFFIGKQLSRDRISTYQGQKLPLLTTAIGKPDTQSIWYAKEHLEKLLEEITYAGGDGLCMSFGTYESTHEYAGQTCLVMNATRAEEQNGITVHRTVELEDEPDFEQRSALPRDLILFPGEDEDGKKDFNYGSPCPPRCDPPPSEDLG